MRFRLKPAVIARGEVLAYRLYMLTAMQVAADKVYKVMLEQPLSRRATGAVIMTGQ